MKSLLPSPGVLGRSGLRLAGLSALVLALSCGGGGGGGTSGGGGTNTPPPANTIFVGDAGTNVFSPSTLTVAKGTIVAWVWKSPGHALQSGDGCTFDGSFSSDGIRTTGFTQDRLFDTPGTFHYFCTTHCGTQMKGTIIVQ